MRKNKERVFFCQIAKSWGATWTQKTATTPEDAAVAFVSELYGRDGEELDDLNAELATGPVSRTVLVFNEGEFAVEIARTLAFKATPVVTVSGEPTPAETDTP